MFTLVVEGWRSYPQSFSVVNQSQCLEILKRDDVRLYHKDVPPPPGRTLRVGREWQPDASLWGEAESKALAAIPAPPEGASPDAVFRIFFPIDFSAAGDVPAFVFAVVEQGRLGAHMIAGRKTLAEALPGTRITIVTPSNWSKKGLVASGAAESQVAVVPHGVDTRVFRPAVEEERAGLRNRLGWEGAFVFLHVGAQYEWKGTGLALKAFAAVAEKHAHARLVLKGIDAVYASRASLENLERGLTSAERALVGPRLRYLGNTLSYAALADLYRAADALLSPYHAEGFNLPVLEAAACGLPAICTKGGPTDDFVRDEFALRIESRIVPAPGGEGVWLMPDRDHLVALMLQAMEDSGLESRARETGPAHVRANYTWARATGLLLDALMGRQRPVAEEP